jgi:hypothetical protein
MKLYDSVSLTRRSSKENKVPPRSELVAASSFEQLDMRAQAISTALTEPVFFNVIDPRYLKP